MTYRQRFILLMLIDSCIVLTVILVSWFLVGVEFNLITLPLIISSMAILLSHHLFGIICKFYKKVWEYASIGELLIILKISSYSILVGAIVQQLLIQEIHFRFLVVTM